MAPTPDPSPISGIKDSLPALNLIVRTVVFAFSCLMMFMLVFMFVMSSGSPSSIGSNRSLALLPMALLPAAVIVVMCCALDPEFLGNLLPKRWKYREWYGLVLVYLSVPGYLWLWRWAQTGFGH